MQELKLSQSANIRQRFMRDMRNLHRDSIKKRARSQIIKHTAQEDIGNLIGETKYSVNQPKLTKLINYANQKHHKIIIHLGNLILDKIVSIQQISKMTLSPDYHPNWMWLIEVLADQSYSTIPLLQHCLKAIYPIHHYRTIQHALCILYKVVLANEKAIDHIVSDKSLLSFINATFYKDASSKIAYLLIHQLLVKDNKVGIKISEGILRERLVQSLKSGLISNSLMIRQTCYNIIKQLADLNINLKQLNLSFIKIIKKQDIDEFTDNLMSCLVKFIQLKQSSEIIKMIDMGLLIDLARRKTQLEAESDDKKIQKIIEISRQIQMKTQDCERIGIGIYNQLHRLQLLQLKMCIDN